MRLQNNSGRNIQPINKRESQRVTTTASSLVRRFFTTKDARVVRILFSMMLVLLSFVMYMKAQEAMYVYTDAQILEMYKKFGDLFARAANLLGAANLGTASLNFWTMYAKMKAYTGNTSGALMAALGVTFVTAPSTGLYKTLPDAFGRSIDWDHWEALAISHTSMGSLPGAVRMLTEVFSGQHVTPQSRIMADQIRKELILPMYTLIIGLLKTNLLSLTADGVSLLTALAGQSLESTNSMLPMLRSESPIKLVNK